jgi:hypothetical protein
MGQRRRAVLVGVALLLLGAAGAVAWLVRPVDPPAVDAFAVDQVAQRYRALGADLLAGAERCAPLAPQPGQTEHVGCTIATGRGPLGLELTTYDTSARLREARDRAMEAGPGSARSARADAGDGAFVMDEAASGGSRLYWDVEVPRPVSAAVADSRPLGELVAFYDARRFAVVQRPEQPGAAFTDPRLWLLAHEVLRGHADAGCTEVPPAAEYPGAQLQVTCHLPDGIVADFGTVPDPAAFTRLRTALASPPGIVPGSQWIGGWQGSDGRSDGQQLTYYALAEGNASRLYYDSREALGFGLLSSDGLTPEQLHAFWQNA